MDSDQCRAAQSTVADPLWVKVRPEWIEKELARRSCLDMLLSRFGLDAALVSVPQLGKVMGMSKSTIYAGLKAGTFFIPHRLIGASPVFTIDDVVSWYLAGDEQTQSKPPPSRGGSGASGKLTAEIDHDDCVELLLARDKRARDRAVEAMVARAVNAVAQRQG